MPVSSTTVGICPYHQQRWVSLTRRDTTVGTLTRRGTTVGMLHLGYTTVGMLHLGYTPVGMLPVCTHGGYALRVIPVWVLNVRQLLTRVGVECPTGINPGVPSCGVIPGYSSRV